MSCFCLFLTQDSWWIHSVSVVRGWAAERTSKTGRSLWRWMQLVSESRCWTELQAGSQLPHNKDTQGKAAPSKARQIHTQPKTHTQANKHKHNTNNNALWKLFSPLKYHAVSANRSWNHVEFSLPLHLFFFCLISPKESLSASLQITLYNTYICIFCICAFFIYIKVVLSVGSWAVWGPLGPQGDSRGSAAKWEVIDLFHCKWLIKECWQIYIL